MLLNPGDVCLVPDPGYPDYWSGVALARAQMKFMPLTALTGFFPTMARSHQQTEKSEADVLNYPNNPTSAVAPLSFYEDTVAFAAEHGIVVASDFAYGAIGFDGDRPVSFYRQKEPKELAWNFTRSPKPIIWPDGALALPWGTKIISLINMRRTTSTSACSAAFRPRGHGSDIASRLC